MTTVNRPSSSASRAWRFVAPLLIAIFAFIFCPQPQAQTITILHTFLGMPTDGAFPQASLIRDDDGNLYGVTRVGGTLDNGMVFRLDPDGTIENLHSFTAFDGFWPVASLVRDPAGNLYGTTEQGGFTDQGVLFELVPGGPETTLHSLKSSEGSLLFSNLVRDAAGNLYGTADLGGTSGLGTIFKLDPFGTLTVLHSFHGGDGAEPLAGLLRDGAGNLYGTTSGGSNPICGGIGCGTIFKLDPAGTLSLLYSFHGRDGAFPLAGVIADASGNLYGTTVAGGDFNDGVVFKLDPAGKLTVLHSFDGTDGLNPKAALVRDPKGILYGTTYLGGDNNLGTVFEVDPATRRFKVVHSFAAGPDGAYPLAGLIPDGKGNLLGTTSGGGDVICEYGNHGCGVVFQISIH